MNKKSSLLPVFALCCVVGALLTFFGLRLYYHDSRLAKTLTVAYDASAFSVLSGQAKHEDGSLHVTEVYPDKLSQIRLEQLAIHTRFYDAISIEFAEKEALQPLQLRLHLQHQATDINRPILYLNNMRSRISLKDLPASSVIDAVGVSTDKLFTPYRLRAIRFEPKPISNVEFVHLIVNSLVPQHYVRSPTQLTRTLPAGLLIAPKVLLLIYFAVVGGLLLLYCLMRKRPVSPAWWLLLVTAWLVIDGQYVWEKTRLSYAQHTVTTAQINTAVVRQPPVPEVRRATAMSQMAMSQMAMSQMAMSQMAMSQMAMSQMAMSQAAEIAKITKNASSVQEATP